MLNHRPRCNLATKPISVSHTLLDQYCTCLHPDVKVRARVIPHINWDRPVQVFLSELRHYNLRQYGPRWTPFVCAGTDAPERYDRFDLSRDTSAEKAGNATGRIIWIANNKSQVLDFIHNTHVYATQLRELNEQKKESTDMSTHTKAEALRQQALMLLERANELEARPDEPTGTEDGTNVIWWIQQFTGGGTEYTYSAVKAGDGLWYTTGPRTPKGYTWDELIQWIYEKTMEPPVIWHATEWATL